MVRRPLRRLLLAGSRTRVASAAAGAVERMLPAQPGVLTVLTYHRIDTPEARPDLLPSLISASPAAFAQQMHMVAARYRPVSMRAVLEAFHAPAALPPRALLVTFDDGYRDFAAHAWPVMRALGIPATMFVATAFSDDPSRAYWWDRLWAAIAESPRTEPLRSPVGTVRLGSVAERHASFGRIRDRIKGLPHDVAMAEVDQLIDGLGAPGGRREPAVLGWEELRGLAADGVTLAPHTRTHPLLDRIPLDRAIDEIRGAADDLDRAIGGILPVFAYPSGAHGGDAIEAVRRAGMTLAFTTVRGGQDVRTADPLRLRRINVGGQAGPGLIGAQITWASRIDARRVQPD